MRLLFVDDEPEILKGLKRMLFDCNDDWESRFASSGAEGLQLLDETPADVVVSDMRMPQLDGVRFLELVKERYPNTIRFILSGQTEERNAVRALKVAHQFLAKPIDASQFVGLIEQTAALVTMMDQENMRSLLGNVSELPAVPHVYHELSIALTDPDVGTGDIVKLVQHEPTMTAKILQIVNSAFFGLRTSTSDLQTAVNHLGMNTIRHLVLAAEVFDAHGLAGKAEPRSVELLRERALRTAKAAEFLAMGSPLRGEAFTMGLLANIGQFVLALAQRDAWEQCRRRAAELGTSLHDEEFARFGTSHAEVGGFLLGIWGLPFSVVEAVTQHHHPERTLAPVAGPAAISAIATSFVEGTALAPGWLERVGATDCMARLREQFPEGGKA